MSARYLASCYRALAVLAFVSLWGPYAWNGGLVANLLAPLRGRLNDHIELKNDFTGIFPIDYLISLLVAFFFFATNGSDEGFQLTVFEGYSTLQSAFVWLYAEMARPGNKPWVISTPVLFAILWQCLGGAVALPLYYARHIIWIDTAETLQVRDTSVAKALPFSFLLGAVIPAIMGCAPTWERPGSRTAEAHQKHLAFFQVDPLWVMLTQAILTKAFRQFNSTSSDIQQASKPAQNWIRVGYIAAAASSTIGHLYTVARIYSSSDENTNFLRMRVPSSLNGPTGGVPDMLARGTFLYLQLDIIIFDVASLFWAFTLLSRLPSLGMSRTRLALVMLAGWFVIGAGGTVSLALLVREGLLPVKSSAARE
ncbi:hypothetical protein GGR57DRAFT_503411 [Xylariaceae sp. FL1272]|nr:hypothetical protein GGR57DRAFT_503411 [Xylariaceae sp. FL1272]